MKIAKYILGGAIIAAGIAYSIYLGVWIMLIGGIIQIVNAVQASPIVGSEIAFGIAKIVFCELAAAIAYVSIIVGGLILGTPIKRLRIRKKR